MNRKALGSLNSRFATALIACLILGALPAASQSLLVNGQSSATLTFAASLGSNPDVNTQKVTVTAKNAAGTDVSVGFTVGLSLGESSQAWASHVGISHPGGGTTPVDITFAANSILLPAGTYQVVYTINAPGYTSARITLTLTVGGTGTIGTLQPSAATLTFNSNFQFNPDAQAITVSSATSTTFSITWQVNAPAGSNWLSAFASTSVVGPSTPAQVTVSVIPGSITTGTYTGTITLTPASGTPTTIGVTFNYGTSGGGSSGGILSATPSPLVLNTTAGTGANAFGTLTITGLTTNTPYFVSVQTQTGTTGWLTLQSGGFGTTPGVVSVAASPLGLPAGTYYGLITLTPSGIFGGAATTVQVQFNVGGGGTGLLGLSPSSLSFNSAVGGAPQQNTLSIQSSFGSFLAAASVATPIGGNWLSVTPTTGFSTPAILTVTANPAGLGTGTYTGTITVTSQTGTTDFATVVLNVGTTGGGTGGLTVSPGALAFSATSGSGQTASQILAISSSTGSTIQFTAASQSAFLTVTPSNGFTPSNITVQANATGLSAGTYQGSILITGGGGSVSVPVLFAVGSLNSTVNISPASLSMNGTSGGTTVSGSVSVNSISGASVGFSTSVFGASWLTVGATSAFTPTSLTLTANPFGLANGIYTGFVVVQPADNSTPQVAAVTFNVGVIGGGGGTGNNVFTVSPAGLTFSVAQGGAAPPGQALTVRSIINQFITFTAAATTQSGGNWLTVNPTAGLASLEYPVLALVDPAGLATGTYQGTVTITAQSLTVSIPITLNVTGPAISVSPTGLAFTAGAGGSAPATQTINVTTPSGAASASFTTAVTTTSGNWLSATPASGSTPGAVTVSVNQAGLTIGSYTGQVRITQSGAANPSVVNVSLNVIEAFTMTVAVNQVTLTARAGDTTPQTRAINVNASSGNRAFTAAASGGAWLTVTPASGNSPAVITISANPSGLAARTYNGTVTVTMAGASNTPQTIQVTFTVNPRGPSVNAVLNAAAMVPAFFAGGTIFSIFGENLGPQDGVGAQLANNVVSSTLAGVRVLVDGTPAPLLYVQARQINGVIPFAVIGRATAEVVVEFQGERSAAQPIQLFDAAPGIFTLDSSGRGPAAVLNQDNTVNSAANPAAKESVVSVFVTGAGQTTPPGVDGLVPTTTLPEPLLNVTARIGDQEMEVLYAGAAPGLVSGAIQVNVRVAASAPSGQQPLVIRVGRFSSQFGATVAIR